jgi:hypothetical protein
MALGDDGDAETLDTEASITFEDELQSIKRLVKGLNVTSSAAYPVFAEQSAVTDFKAKFFSTDEDEARKFRRTNCSTLEETLASIQNAMRDRIANPTSADLSMQRMQRGMTQVAGAYAAAVQRTPGAAVEGSEADEDMGRAVGAYLSKNAGKKAASGARGGGRFDKSKSPCTACGELGHWYSDGKCEQGKKLVAERAAANAAAGGGKKAANSDK